MISVYKDFDDVPKGLENGDLTEAKKRLREIYHGKCAYTEQKISEAETYILRYRPVNEYPWLEFEWSNLLPVCRMVFERLRNYYAHKKFLVQGKKITQKPKNEEDFKADSELMLSEKPLLLHTEVDTIENFINVSKNGRLYSFSKKGNSTIEIFNLNSENLIQKRLKFIELEQIKISKIFNDYKKQNIDTLDYLLFDYFSLLNPIFLTWVKLSKNKYEFSVIYKTALLKGSYGLFISDEIFEEREFLSDYMDYFNEFIWNISKQNDSELYFVVKNFFLLKNFSMKNLDMSNQWIFLTGENGFGKTLILQAFYIAIFGKENHNYPFKIDENSRFEIKFQFIRYINNILIPIPIKYSNIIGGQNLLNSQNSYIEKATVAYGANRLNISGYINEDEKTQAPQKVSKSDSLFKSNGTLYNIEAYLTKMHGREQYAKRIESIIKVLIDLLPSVAAIEIDDSEVDKKVYYRETAENGDLLNRIRFHQLSAGNKSIIAMIGDMLTEFYEGQPDVENSKDFVGIVLIDEIDAHLHPKWQRELVIKLTELFPKVQFIASTHSPIPLLGAPKETVIFNVEKPDRKTGIQVRRLDIDVSKLTPNTILTSPIFGFDDIIPNSRDKEEKLYTQDSYNEVVFEKMLHEKLDNLAKEGGKSLEELLEIKR